MEIMTTAAGRPAVRSGGAPGAWGRGFRGGGGRGGAAGGKRGRKRPLGFTGKTRRKCPGVGRGGRGGGGGGGGGGRAGGSGGRAAGRILSPQACAYLAVV